MKLELKEHEIEQALEVFISSFVTNFPVRVNGFDLQGMRSKDGLSAIVEFDVVGVSDLREQKLDSINVSPTNTSWRTERAEEQKEIKPELEGKDLQDWAQFLSLITDNAMYKNYDNIMNLLETSSEIIQHKIKNNDLFQEMLQEVDKQIQSIAENTIKTIEESTKEEPIEQEVEQEEPSIEVEHAEALKEELSTEPVRKNILNSPIGEKPTNIHTASTTTKKLFA